jgi:hypothetical protein
VGSCRDPLLEDLAEVGDDDVGPLRPQGACCAVRVDADDELERTRATRGNPVRRRLEDRRLTRHAASSVSGAGLRRRLSARIVFPSTRAVISGVRPARSTIVAAFALAETIAQGTSASWASSR